MEERREIVLNDFDKNYAPHMGCLEEIRNYNYSSLSDVELLSILKNSLFNEADNFSKFELSYELMVNAKNEICLNCTLVKTAYKVPESYNILFAPFEVWVRTNVKNIYYRHKNLTNSWCTYLINKFPLYLSPLLKHLVEEKNRLHMIVDKEFDEKLRYFSQQLK